MSAPNRHSTCPKHPDRAWLDANPIDLPDTWSGWQNARPLEPCTSETRKLVP